MRKHLMLPWALLLLAACSKEDKPLVSTPVPTTTAGRFSVSFPRSYYTVDSLEGRFLQRDGQVLSITRYGASDWVSPAGDWNAGDTFFVSVKAWGRKNSDSLSLLPSIVYSGTTLRGSEIRFDRTEDHSQPDTATHAFVYRSQVYGRF